MKKYTFRLEQVRRIRQTQEDVARAALLNANSEVQRALASAEGRMAEYVGHMPSAAVIGVDTFMRQRYFNDLAGQAVVIAREAHAAAEAQAATRRAEWSDAASRVKVLDRLDERRREEYEIEHAREVEKENDDLVTGRFGNRGES